MTWGEFKKAVEEKGVKDEDEISYIDCDMMCGRIICDKPDDDKAWRIH